MKVPVRMAIGPLGFIEAEPSDLVETLKERIAEICEYPAKCMRLYTINVEMLNGHTLQEYHPECGVNYEHAIMMIPELRKMKR